MHGFRCSAAVLLALIASCGVQGSETIPPAASSASTPAVASGGQKPSTPTATAPATKPLRLKKHTVADPIAGCDACTLLVPEGWKVEGGIVWQMQYSNLASANVRVSDPSSRATLEVFPVVPGCWDEGGASYLTPGQNYMGSIVAPPPRDVRQYVTDYFVPGYRAKAEGLKIGAATPLPDVAKLVEKSVQEQGLTKTVMAGKVRLEYVERGTPIAEDVYITCVVSRTPAMPGSVYWSLQQQYSFRAEKDAIDAHAPLLQAMVSSVQVELKWYAGYVQVLQMRQQGQMQAIRDAGEISRAISRNNDAMIASMRSTWAEQQASQARVSRQFSESIRGVETYANTLDGRAVELPSGYADVWVNSSGDYLLSNTGGYDPNAGSTLEWRRLTPQR
jgi:hypothetical protein